MACFKIGQIKSLLIKWAGLFQNELTHLKWAKLQIGL